MHEIELKTRQVTFESYKSFADCFSQAAKYLKGKTVLINSVKTHHDAFGYKLKLFLVEDLVETDDIKDLTKTQKAMLLLD
jgi:hypothetical protein